MSEHLYEFLSKPRGQLPEYQLVGKLLLASLTSLHPNIQAIRSYEQGWVLTPNDSEGRELLLQGINPAASGLNPELRSLFTIDLGLWQNNHYLFFRESHRFYAINKEDTPQLRGFEVVLDQPEVLYQIFLLDKDETSENFSKMDRLTRRMFLNALIETLHSRAPFKREDMPPAYWAVLTGTGPDYALQALKASRFAVSKRWLPDNHPQKEEMDV